MTWIAEDNFESYSNGDLNGGSGGSNWSTNWAGSTDFDVQDTVVNEGSKAVKVTHGNGENFDMVRTFSGISAGVVYVDVRRSTNSNGNFYVILREGATSRVFIRFGADGNISIYDHDITDYQTIQAYSADTWYRLGIEFDDASEAEKARANIDNGTWTSWYTVNGGSYTNIDTIRFNATDSSSDVDAYFDFIGPDYATTSTSTSSTTTTTTSTSSSTSSSTSTTTTSSSTSTSTSSTTSTSSSTSSSTTTTSSSTSSSTSTSTTTTTTTTSSSTSSTSSTSTSTSTSSTTTTTLPDDVIIGVDNKDDYPKLGKIDF